MKNFFLLLFATISFSWNCKAQNELFPAAFKQFNQFKKENTIITGTPESRLIKNVGEKLFKASIKFLDANGYRGVLDPFEFEFILVENSTANAWAMPGGKIAFNTGILPVAQNETGIAVLMAHLFGHVFEGHGSQRLSIAQRSMLEDVGSKGLNEYHRQIFEGAYGLDTEIFLPFEPRHESNADWFGLTIMAIAGYDPSGAAEVWSSIEEENAEFSSIHPTDFSSIQDIRLWASEAKAEAQLYGVKND